jgi:hypothetical protein
MSDYLTNLVSRSFSSLAPVQPRTASLYAAPEVFESSLEKFSDPFEAAESSNDEDSAMTEELDQRKRTEDKPQRTEAPRGESPRLDQTSIAAPITSRADAITPLQREDTAASANVRGRSNQPESRATPKQARRKPGTIAPPIIDVSLPSSVRPTDLTPLQETTGVPAAKSAALQGKAFQREELQEIPRGSSGIAPLIKSAPEGDIHGSALLAKPFDSDNSVQQLQKKPGQLSPQILAAALMPFSATGDKSQRPELSGSVAASDDRQVRNSPSTIIPKVQPPLTITVNRGPNAASGQVPFETAAQPPLTETIVNVAIGRIEVRATSTESAKREQQAKGPKVMNLDDYMQQRSRGHR